MYDELVKSLRICSRCDFGQDCNGCTQKSDDAFCCDKLLHEAADAIEQLSADLERSKEWAGFWQEEAGEALKKFQTTVAKIPRWIPVTERLPEILHTVIISGRMKYAWETNYFRFVDVATYTEGEFFETFNDWYEGQDEFEITHWMPLPQPPKAEEGE